MENLLDTLSHEALTQALLVVGQWPDSSETAVRIARAASRYPETACCNRLAHALAFRGHLAEALRDVGSRRQYLLVELALHGMIPRDSAEIVFRGWLDNPNTLNLPAPHHFFGVYYPVGWWSTTGDTAALKGVAAWWDNVNASDSLPTALVSYSRESTQAFLALARRDTLEAIRRLDALPECPNGAWTCRWAHFTRVELHSVLGNFGVAAPLVNRPFFDPAALYPSPNWVLWKLIRGRVNEALGNRALGIQAYSLRHRRLAVWRRRGPAVRRGGAGGAGPAGKGSELRWAICEWRVAIWVTRGSQRMEGSLP